MSKGVTAVFGVSESRAAFEASKIIKEKRTRYVVITATEGRAKSFAEDLSFFVGRDIPYLPHEDALFINYEARDREQLMRRLNALHDLREHDDAVIVAPVSAAIKKTIPSRVFDDKRIEIERGREYDLEEIKEGLISLGYERLPVVEGKGSFSIRGGILDVFTPEADHPYRAEFFGDEVDSLRTFDLDSQRSLEDIKSIKIGPAEEMIADRELFEKASSRIREEYDKQIKIFSKLKDHEDAVKNLIARRDKLTGYCDDMINLQLLESYIRFFYDDTEYIWDIKDDIRIIIDDPARAYDFLETRSQEMMMDFETMIDRGELIPGDSCLMTGEEDLAAAAGKDGTVFLMPFAKQVKHDPKFEKVINKTGRQMTSFNGKMDVLSKEIRANADEGRAVYIVASTDERRKNLSEFIGREDLRSGVKVVPGSLSSGFVDPEDKLCYISDNDIFGVKRTVRKKKYKSDNAKPLHDFTELNKGDYVVHENRGIGKFLGIKKMEVDDREKDYLIIKYAGDDMLYVPVERFDLVQKYIGSEGAAPKLNKLSGNEWAKTKQRARYAIAHMTEELVDLYAKRKMKKGYAFEQDDVWQREFEERFPFQETDDQLRCTDEIKSDMEKPEAMDRLLLGDVGFGKTEVAARAICKCVLNGKQAAILVPTTLLANQHYYTLKERFEGLPVTIEMMSRFKSESELGKIAKEVREGAVDIVIGTHRLLSKDVRFKDLGLLVVDEEQRFGVAHKERIKELKENVDVLTLSATPIPRTLNMSLTGIKDMSLITEPPEERYPVQTYVMEQNEQMIREAILRETERGGQVFIVYNRIRGINLIADRIAAAVPEVKVGVGHGRMNEHALENVMLSFVDHEIDVLIATTIIESGIDIQNANTLIVLDSDRFGLAQLYQLKGRVGRSNRIAYAYFMYEKNKVLNEVAEKRLRAIREFTEFGSGFKVAMRDLELRGAGNLLGAEQSGHMMNIGYELYCKLVDEQVRKLKGEEVNEDHVETNIDIHVTANIPDWYIEDETIKLDMYKRISFVRTFDEESDIIDELKDRFGEVPRETLDLIKIARIKGLADMLRIRRISEHGSSLVFSFDEKNAPGPETMVKIMAEFSRNAMIHGGKRPSIKMKVDPLDKLDECIRLLEVAKGAE